MVKTYMIAHTHTYDARNIRLKTKVFYKNKIKQNICRIGFDSDFMDLFFHAYWHDHYQ